MIKTILIIMVSASVSAGTAIAVMMRYSNAVPSYQTFKNDLSQKPNDEILSNPIGNEAASVVQKDDPETATRCTTDPRLKYFDYGRLIQDLKHVSDTLESFNSLLAKEIDRLKGSQDNSEDAASGSS